MHHLFFVILSLIGFLNISYGDWAPKSLTESYHPRYSTVGNPNISPEHDCALRAFTIEMATYIEPTFSKTNWTTLSQSAFQMNQCNGTSHTAYQPSSSDKLFKTAPEIKKGTCHHTVFVHDLKGNNLFDGTFERPMKTIQAALSLTRTLRAVHDSGNTLCITIRGGTYYLGTNATIWSSQIGAIALTSDDSNLVIENYQDERVILSGGTLLQLQWSVHAKTATGGTIMKAQVPPSVNLDQFNELYIDDRRAIVAKYPNGDPSTQGLYAKDPGFSYDSQRWWPPNLNRSVEIHVQEPSRNGTVFTNYQLGLGGGAAVFNPPRNFWSTASPPAGDNYAVPSGLTVKNGALPHISNWSTPTTGFVHAFHSGYWGSWIFEIASINSTQNTIIFGRGGFQEARGSRDGGAFYVANIFEELDSPNEWFLDRDTRTLYFMPNETMPNVFVASQISCLISVSGSGIENPVHNVLIRGLILTQTSSTYMRDYMVPSGGDWAVHRGGTMYLTNTKNVTITRHLFTQLGSNGVALIDFNDATSITLNEFVWLADSAIILVGSTNGIDGFSVASQPANTLIQSNLIHETGIYVKQSSPVLISVSRSVSVIGNLMFNMPRAAINVNDGFYGNHTISWNVLFNTVRETSDHGPINSWDRQPFLTDAVQPGLPSLWQHGSYIHHNTLFNNYRSVWPIDHDDGSCFYEDSYNFQVYGGKKNYLGHSKTDHHEIYVYSDVNGGGFGSNVCLSDYAPTRGSSGWNETWIQNTCVLYQSPVPYNIENCDTANIFVPYLANNKIYIPSGTQVAFTCKVNGSSTRLSLEQWQSYGLDIGTTVQTAPDVQTIIEWGREMLQRTT
ncbi:unnamed protein product [Didymodactylos carnosus]|uniref:Uncharacterized protein n=1 Tax=Didymodactylos carnosus TaxID=1234261 RepID=A0A814HH61_9BILA|nr:unnamed protein product [Didymodactylos carnosus]CAF1141969.1 unnamed protein product [Didymodactylos carnosus]CAF3781279.1 unnamed protein product [Didymodactylos carnosus]CAF3938498.1 unnamed protein product [Didymodactylos carnosus]